MPCLDTPWYYFRRFGGIHRDIVWHLVRLRNKFMEVSWYCRCFPWFRGTSVADNKGCVRIVRCLVFPSVFKILQGPKKYECILFFHFSPWQVLTSLDKCVAWCTCGVTRLKISGTQHWYQQEAVLFHRTTRLPAAIRPRQTPAGWGQNAHSASVGLCLPNTTRA